MSVSFGIILRGKAPTLTHVPDCYMHGTFADKEGKKLLCSCHGPCLQRISFPDAYVIGFVKQNLSSRLFSFSDLTKTF